MFEKVRDIIAELLALEKEKDTITLNAHYCDLGADSLDMVEIVSRIEDEFSIEIPDEEFYSWKTVKDIMNYLEEHV